jgi:long-chain acyl-CoA synthetase
MYITQGLKRAVQLNGHSIATVNGERKRTWAEFGERVTKLAGAFVELGLNPGERVAILSLNSDRYLEYYYAVPWAGGAIVPLNIRLAPPELIYMLNDSEAKFLIVDDTFQAMLPAFADKLKTVEQVIFAGDSPTPEKTVNYEEILAAANPISDAERGGNDLAGILYTGGTTSIAKGVMLSHNNIVSNAMNAIAGLSYNEETSYLHVAPMFHAADCASTFGITIVAGRHVFVPKFDPADTLTAIQNQKVNICLLVPTMVNMIANFPDAGDYDISSLKRILYGASPMPLAVLRKAMETFPNTQFIQGYGMTETSPLITLLDSKFHILAGAGAEKVKSAGRSCFTVEVKIVDSNDDELPLGEIGEIVTRGPHVMQGYWKQPELTAAAIREGWMHTGDAGYMDEEGFIFIVDRVKDMIISGGENVYSIEVENALFQHPNVGQCAVFGIPDDQWGEAVYAIVVPKNGDGLGEAALGAHCRQLIAGYKCPRSIEIRYKLRAPFWKDKERQVN